MRGHGTPRGSFIDFPPPYPKRALNPPPVEALLSAPITANTLGKPLHLTWRSTLKAYKLLRKRRDGTLGPLFINRSQRLPLGLWLEAEDHPTKGYAHRPGWHTTIAPEAPHLKAAGRVWAECEIEDYYLFERPAHQGGEWLIAQRMRLNRVMA